MKDKALYLFDLDGVIIDSRKNMESSWNLVNKKFKLDITFEKYFSLIGRDFKEILRELKIKNKNLDEIEKTFKNVSLKNFNEYKLYPKVKVVLRSLTKKKIKIGIVTSKDCIRTKKILKKFSLKFNEIRCSNGKLPGKPKPDKILSILEKLKIKKAYTVYIGDMMVDKKTAKNAGVEYIHALYGYSPKKINHKNTIQSFNDLIKT
jgi:HAD superfamily hydrolase (TIGR01549 family)